MTAAPTRQFSDSQQPRTPEIIVTAVEQIRATLGADGAILAVRNASKLRFFARAGNVPDGSPELQLSSAFTRECVDSGNINVCGDAQNDARIDPEAARLLFLKSAIAVPIQFQGSLIAIIELFSSMPFAFSAAHLETLQEISGLLAPILVPHACLIAEPTRDSTPSTDLQAIVVPSLKGTAEDIWALPPMLVKRPVATVPDRVQANSAPPVVPIPPPAFLAPAEARRMSAMPVVLLSPEQGLNKRAMVSGIAAAFIVALAFGFTRNIRTAAPAVPVSSAMSNPASLESANSWTRPNSIPQTPHDSTAAEIAQDSPSVAEPSPPEISAPAVSQPIQNGALTKTSEQVAESPRENSSSAALAEEITALPSPSLERTPSTGLFAPATIVAHGNGTEASAPRTVPEASNSASGTLPVTSSSDLQPDFVLDHTLRAHSSWVTGVAFTSGGNRLVSGSWDKTVRMWDVRTGTQIGTVSNTINFVQSVASSRDGLYFAAENSSDNVTLWDATTGFPIHTLATDRHFRGAGSNWVYSIAFSPDGKMLATGVDDKTVRLWDVKTGQAIRDLTGSRRSIIYVAFSPDGRFLATGANEKTITIWDVSTGAALQNLSGHKKSVYAAAFSPDGRWLASASADKTVRIWDLQQGRQVHSLLGHTNLVTTLAFSPNGRWLASGSWDKTIRIWDVESGRGLQTLNGHTHSIYALAFDSRGRWIASGSEDGTINLWRWSSLRASRN